MSFDMVGSIETVISNINDSIEISVTNPHLLTKYVCLLFGVDTSYVEDKVFNLKEMETVEQDVGSEITIEDFGPHLVYNPDSTRLYYICSFANTTVVDTFVIVVTDDLCLKFSQEGIPPSYGYCLNVITIKDLFSIVGKLQILDNLQIMNNTVYDLYFDVFVKPLLVQNKKNIVISIYAYKLPNLDEHSLIRNVDMIVESLGKIKLR